MGVPELYLLEYTGAEYFVFNSISKQYCSSMVIWKLYDNWINTNCPGYLPIWLCSLGYGWIAYVTRLQNIQMEMYCEEQTLFCHVEKGILSAALRVTILSSTFQSFTSLNRLQINEASDSHENINILYPAQFSLSLLMETVVSLFIFSPDTLLFLSWPPGVATTPTCGCHSSTHTPTARSQWRASLTTHSTRQEGWGSIHTHTHKHSHCMRQEGI